MDHGEEKTVEDSSEYGSSQWYCNDGQIAKLPLDKGGMRMVIKPPSDWRTSTRPSPIKSWLDKKRGDEKKHKTRKEIEKFNIFL